MHRSVAHDRVNIALPCGFSTKNKRPLCWRRETRYWQRIIKLKKICRQRSNRQPIFIALKNIIKNIKRKCFLEFIKEEMIEFFFEFLFFNIIKNIIKKVDLDFKKFSFFKKKKTKPKYTIQYMINISCKKISF
mmetsp:Transcript_8247/g.14231  ORF Transcript_8247/g.14231 Transcript_8247/m.14231 type:complete len:133 (+) Transcript_8247:325-723(+)